jgi:uncharacterized membrane protein YheB (UPF0754 family)
MQMPWWIYFGPVAGALLGFMLVWAARWLVFHPVSEKRMGPLRIQGLIWQRRPAIAKEIAAACAGFIDIDSLGATITAPESVEKILPQAEARIDEFLRVRLVKAMPVVGMFVGDKTINQLKALFVQELRELFPGIMQGYLSGLQQDINISLLIEKKLNEIPDEKILSLFTNATQSIWRYAFAAAAVIGLLSGLVQVFLFSLAGRLY